MSLHHPTPTLPAHSLTHHHPNPTPLGTITEVSPASTPDKTTAAGVAGPVPSPSPTPTPGGPLITDSYQLGPAVDARLSSLNPSYHAPLTHLGTYTEVGAPTTGIYAQNGIWDDDSEQGSKGKDRRGSASIRQSWRQMLGTTPGLEKRRGRSSSVSAAQPSTSTSISTPPTPTTSSPVANSTAAAGISSNASASENGPWPALPRGASPASPLSTTHSQTHSQSSSHWSMSSAAPLDSVGFSGRRASARVSHDHSASPSISASSQQVSHASHTTHALHSPSISTSSRQVMPEAAVASAQSQIATAAENSITDQRTAPSYTAVQATAVDADVPTSVSTFPDSNSPAAEADSAPTASNRNTVVAQRRRAMSHSTTGGLRSKNESTDLTALSTSVSPALGPASGSLQLAFELASPAIGISQRVLSPTSTAPPTSFAAAAPALSSLASPAVPLVDLPVNSPLRASNPDVFGPSNNKTLPTKPNNAFAPAIAPATYPSPHIAKSTTKTGSATSSDEDKKRRPRSKTQGTQNAPALPPHSAPTTPALPTTPRTPLADLTALVPQAEVGQKTPKTSKGAGDKKVKLKRSKSKSKLEKIMGVTQEANVFSDTENVKPPVNAGDTKKSAWKRGVDRLFRSRSTGVLRDSFNSGGGWKGDASSPPPPVPPMPTVLPQARPVNTDFTPYSDVLPASLSPAYSSPHPTPSGVAVRTLGSVSGAAFGVVDIGDMDLGPLSPEPFEPNDDYLNADPFASAFGLRDMAEREGRRSSRSASRLSSALSSPTSSTFPTSVRPESSSGRPRAGSVAGFASRVGVRSKASVGNIRSSGQAQTQAPTKQVRKSKSLAAGLDRISAEADPMPVGMVPIKDEGAKEGRMARMFRSSGTWRDSFMTASEESVRERTMSTSGLAEKRDKAGSRPRASSAAALREYKISPAPPTKASMSAAQDKTVSATAPVNDQSAYGGQREAPVDFSIATTSPSASAPTTVATPVPATTPRSISPVRQRSNTSTSCSASHTESISHNSVEIQTPHHAASSDSIDEYHTHYNQFEHTYARGASQGMQASNPNFSQYDLAGKEPNYSQYDLTRTHAQQPGFYALAVNAPSIAPTFAHDHDVELELDLDKSSPYEWYDQLGFFGPPPVPAKDQAVV